MGFNRVSHIQGKVKIEKVIISVFDKAGLGSFVESLVAHCPGIVFYSTGGSLKELSSILGSRARASLVSIANYTGQPEMKGGLVKTLDWKIYLGLLSEPFDEDHAADRKRAEAVAFDMVVANLYPFPNALADPAKSFEERRQHIDIGGPCMLRAAAKNFLRVAPVMDPADYPGIGEEVALSGGALSLQTRAALAAKAFSSISRYDEAVAGFLNDAARNAPASYIVD